MALGRICTRCKSTFVLPTETCPKCNRPLKYKVRYQLPGGRWLTRQTATLADAMAFEAAARPTPAPLPAAVVPTLSDVWLRYWPVVRSRNRSALDDMIRWTRHIGPRLGQVALDRLTAADVYGLLDSIDRAPATVRLVFALLRRMVNWSIEVGMFAGPNVCSRVKLPPLDNVRTRVLNDEEFTRLVAELEDEPNRRFALAVLALIWTGKRRGEVEKLKWDCVSLERAIVTLTATNTKSKKTQTFPLNSKAMAVFKEAERLKISDYVFPACTGHYHHDLGNTWNRWKARHGFEGLWLHDLRRTAISRWARAGLNPQRIMRLSGHNTLSMVMRYTQLSAEDVPVSGAAGQPKTH